MSIRQMLPIGNILRKCPGCGYPITAKSNVLTAHEEECLRLSKFRDDWHDPELMKHFRVRGSK